MTESVAHRDPVEKLAEEFVARLRRGERPAVSEYVAAHPDLADEIRDLFPALLVLEEAKPAGTEPHLSGSVPDPPPLEQLGDYRILREVARGGMGVVYEAEQLALGRHVALKVLPAHLAGDPMRLLRFRREARSAARLHHTNIVPVFDVGAAGGIPYYAMQFIQGQGLDEVLREVRRLRDGGKPAEAGDTDLTASLADGLRAGVFAAAPAVPVPRPGGAPSETSSILTGPGSHYFRSVARLGVQAAEALAYAHGQRVLHRDIKPSNLLLDRQGRLWLTDFGLAKVDTEDLTRTGDIVGTLRYMAPERFEGVSDPHSDTYALGITLYELLTLRPAFDDADRVQLLRRIARDDPPRPRAIDPTIPRDLETVVLKAIEKDPGRRYPTAAELAEDLRRFLADRPIKARRASWREQGWRWCRRNPAVAASLAAAFAFLTLGTAVSAWLAVRATRAERVAEDRLGKETDANKEARLRLFDARRAEARASRFSRRSGQRFGSLEALAEAVHLARDLELGEDVLTGLRDDAIACLALPDIRPVRGWVGPKLEGGGAKALDADLEHHSRHEGGGVVGVRQVTDGRVVALLRPPGPARGVKATLFSADGRTLAVSYAPGEGRTGAECAVWDWRSKTVRYRLPFLITPTARAFSPDGRRAVFGQPDGTLTVHDAATGREESRVRLGSAIRWLAVHSSGKVAAHLSSGDVKVFDPRANKQLFSHQIGDLYCLAWHQDGRHLAGGGRDEVFVWDTHPSTREKLLTLRGHQHHVYGVEFAPRGELLVSRASDGTTRLWDPWLKAEILRVPGNATRFDRAGCRLGGFQGNQQVVLYDVELGGEYRTLPGCPLGAGDGTGAVSASGRWVAVSGAAGVQTWDLATDRRLVFFSQCDNPCFRGDGELLMRARTGIKRWPLRVDGDVLRFGLPGRDPLPPRANPQLAQLWLPHNGRFLGISGQPSLVLDLDGVDGPTLLPDDAWTVTTSPDGRWVAAAEGRTNVPLRLLRRKPRPEPVQSIFEGEGHVTGIFTPDSRHLVAVSQAAVELWTAEPCARVWRLGREQNTNSSLPVALTPDGRLLATPLSPAVVHLIDLATGTTVARLQTPDEDPVSWLGFGLGGTQLVTRTDRSGIVRVWNLRRVREQLREMGLDWNPPASEPPAANPTPVHVEIDPRVAESSRLLRTGREHTQARRFTEAVADFTRALDLNPALLDARTERGKVRASRGEWAAAAADLPPPAVHGAASDLGVQAACLQLLAGDTKGYGLTRARAASEADASPSSGMRRYDASRICTLTVEPKDAARVLVWAERALEATPSPWRLHVLARANYRAGQFEAAVRRAEQSLKADPNWPGRPLNWLLAAVAKHQLGHADEAAKWLSRATQWHDGLARDKVTGRAACPPRLHLTDWLEFHVLLAEANRLIPRQGAKK